MQGCSKPNANDVRRRTTKVDKDFNNPELHSPAPPTVTSPPGYMTLHHAMDAWNSLMPGLTNRNGVQFGKHAHATMLGRPPLPAALKKMKNSACGPMKLTNRSHAHTAVMRRANMISDIVCQSSRITSMILCTNPKTGQTCAYSPTACQHYEHDRGTKAWLTTLNELDRIV